MSLEVISWPSDYQELKRLDTLLKCGICYEYFNTCMITSCSHSYCSICIRKFMQYKSQCPTCFKETFENELRNNRHVDELVKTYLLVRDRILKAIRLAAVAVNPTQTIEEKKECNEEPEPRIFSQIPKKTLVSSQKSSSSSEAGSSKPKVTIPKIFTTSPKKPVNLFKPKSNEEMSTCPVCEVDIPSRNINIHLDACLARSEAKPPPVTPNKTKRAPLPKRLYSLMNDKEIKSYLKSYGLNIQGDRRAWLQRLQRYTVLYNSEADKENPRPLSEILLQVEREENYERNSTKSIKAFATVKRPVVTVKSTEEDIEKANEAYIKENKSSFQKLIENMKNREGKYIKPLKPVQRIESDDSDLEVVPLPDESKSRTSEMSDMPSTSKESEQENVNPDETLADSDHTLFLSDPEIDCSQSSLPDKDPVTPKPTKKETTNIELPEESNSSDSIFDFDRTISTLMKHKTPDNKKRFVKKTPVMASTPTARRKPARKRVSSPELFPDSSGEDSDWLGGSDRISQGKSTPTPDHLASQGKDGSPLPDEPVENEPKRRLSKRVKRSNEALQNGVTEISPVAPKRSLRNRNKTCASPVI